MKIIFKIVVAVVVLSAAVYGSSFVAGMTAAVLGAVFHWGAGAVAWCVRVVRAGGAVCCGVWISLGAVSGYEAEEGWFFRGLKPLTKAELMSRLKPRPTKAIGSMAAEEADPSLRSLPSSG